LEHPVLTAEQLRAVRSVDADGLRSITLPALFPVSWHDGLSFALTAVCRSAANAARAGYGVIVVTDVGATGELAPIPSLLAASAVHHHLIREGLGSRVGIVVESGDAREVSHIALLFAYGASAVHPAVALATAAALGSTEKYIKAVEKGLLKILSKMG